LGGAQVFQPRKPRIKRLFGAAFCYARMRGMTTAIISALPEEQAGLAQLLREPERLTQAPRELQRGLMHGKSVILALAGIGKVAAALTATMLIERHHVQRILFTGVAGGIAPEVDVGDVVVGSAYLQHDMDASPLFPRYELPLTGLARLHADKKLFATILGAINLDFVPGSSLKSLKKHYCPVNL
jgi:adenosylhomocysteine nucleosidase